jgi:hypothetical protein
MMVGLGQERRKLYYQRKENAATAFDGAFARAASAGQEEECVSHCFPLLLRTVNHAQSGPGRDVYSNVEISDEVLARF